MGWQVLLDIVYSLTSYNKIAAFILPDEFRIFQIPQRKHQVLSRERHQLLKFQNGHTRIIWIGPAAVVQQTENAHATVRLAIDPGGEFPHFENTDWLGIAQLILQVVSSTVLRADENFVGLL